MLNTKRSLIIILCILCFEVIIYSVFVRPYILTWGASEEEANMQLIGDDLAPTYSSTRAITLNAPISEAWQSIISLGADRGGFYSYTFMEDMLGYVGKEIDKSSPKVYDMKVGRIVQGSLDESSELIKTLIKKYGWNWTVLAVDPGRAFVLKGWGAFVLREITPNQTRFIVRTHEPELPDLWSEISRFVMIAFHYIMERRMMIGFQAQFEPDIQPSYAVEILWFLSLILSFFGLIALVFIYRGIRSILNPTIFGTLWLFVLFVFNPLPHYSIILSVTIMVMIGGHLYRNKRLTSYQACEKR